MTVDTNEVREWIESIRQSGDLDNALDFLEELLDDYEWAMGEKMAGTIGQETKG